MSDEKKLYRSIQKKLRVTPEENELIKHRMANHHFKNFNTYARYMLLTGEIVMVDYSELIKLRTEINRIGTNINQLAKFVNTTEEFTYARYMLLTGEIVMVDYSELIKLRTEINRIGTNINQLAKFVNTTEEFTLKNYQILQDALVSVKQLMDDNFDKEITIFEKQSRDRRG